MQTYDVRIVTHITRGDSYSVGTVQAENAEDAQRRACALGMVKTFQTFRTVPVK